MTTRNNRRAPQSAGIRPTPAFATTGSKFYPTIAAMFVALLLISNIAATKGIQFGPIITDGGAFLFPLTYILGDVLSEVYGLRAANKVIITGFAAALLAAGIFQLVAVSPPIAGDEWTASFGEAFALVLGVVPQILLASVSGYLFGQLLNAFVLVWIKRRFGERRLWVRLIGSTVVGEFADTLIFCSIAATAIGITSLGQFANYFVVGYLYKTLLEVVLLPITYPVIRAVKKREPSYVAASAARPAERA